MYFSSYWHYQRYLKNINVGDVLITTGAACLDCASLYFAPLEYPVIADFSFTNALYEAAKAAGIPTHIDITASSDTFYPS